MGLNININFSQTINSANELLEVANELERNAVNRFEQALSASQGVWSGDDYDAFREKMSRELTQTRKHVQNIRSYANKVKSGAERLQRLEASLSSLFG